MSRGRKTKVLRYCDKPECERPVYIEGRILCSPCHRDEKHNQKKLGEPNWHPVIEHVREHADDDRMYPEDTRPVPMYPKGVVSFWQKWYKNPDNLCTDEELTRWEDRIGIPIDAGVGWGSTYGTGYNPYRGVKMNTVL